MTFSGYVGCTLGEGTAHSFTLMAPRERVVYALDGHEMHCREANVGWYLPFGHRSHLLSDDGLLEKPLGQGKQYWRMKDTDWYPGRHARPVMVSAIVWRAPPPLSW